ncbi:hypothetical protein ACFL6S_17610 [Candidatus Poribacteria bacterium]
MLVRMTDNRDIAGKFKGTWHIYEMETWDEDYFNMEVQAYIEIKPNGSGEFQFGLVSGLISGDVEKTGNEERFEFTFEASDEFDPVSGGGWLRLRDENSVEGKFRLHMGDDSTFLAKRAESRDEP